MKKVFYPLACLAAGALVACGGQKSGSAQADQPNEVALAYSKSLKAPETDSLKLPVDENGYITIFDGKTFDGWRGYGKDKVPAKWTIEDGCIKFNGTGGGEAQDADGGDLIFAHKFKNFELELEWKVAKGSNSGILYLAQEITSKDKDGNDVLEPIYISAPEYQILDNANHPDAKLGKDNNRQSASLYDMIPAVENEGDYLVDDDALTKTTQLFSVLDETSSAKRYYKAFLQAAGLMINETLVKCKERLNMLLPLDGDYEDESGIVDLRDKKEAIFVTFPADEYYTPAHEFYVKSFMTHLFKTLTNVNAEKLQDSNPVCIFVDDYEYVKNTDMFVGTASILRKYRVSLFVTLSNVLLNDADDVISLLSCSNACVYLGGCRDSYAEHFLAKYFDTDCLIDAIKIKYVD